MMLPKKYYKHHQRGTPIYAQFSTEVTPDPSAGYHKRQPTVAPNKPVSSWWGSQAKTLKVVRKRIREIIKLHLEAGADLVSSRQNKRGRHQTNGWRLKTTGKSCTGQSWLENPGRRLMLLHEEFRCHKKNSRLWKQIVDEWIKQHDLISEE